MSSRQNYSRILLRGAVQWTNLIWLAIDFKEQFRVPWKTKSHILNFSGYYASVGQLAPQLCPKASLEKNPPATFFGHALLRSVLLLRYVYCPNCLFVHVL